MNRFFNFSTPQLRVIIVLIVLLAVLSTWSLLRGYSDVDESQIRFTVSIGDNDRQYDPVFKVDLNRTPVDSLELLPGVGPVLASRIAAYRDSTPFEEPKDIIKVKGIGYNTYEKLRAYIEVSRW